jgi:hypothetical protein
MIPAHFITLIMKGNFEDDIGMPASRYNHSEKLSTIAQVTGAGKELLAKVFSKVILEFIENYNCSGISAMQDIF